MEGTLTSGLLPGAAFDLEEIFGAAKPAGR